jgi:hypothetical protein
MRGDYRALFLGWLADFNPEEWQDPKDGAVLMPPIPTGLNQLSPALTKLIEHFPVDPDALAVAASLTQASTPERVPDRRRLVRVIDREPGYLLDLFPQHAERPFQDIWILRVLDNILVNKMVHVAYFRVLVGLDQDFFPRRVE